MPRGKPIDVEWLKERYPVMTDIYELLDEHERKFGWRPTKTAVYVKAGKLGIRKRPVKGRGDKCERMVKWSKEPEMTAWMLEHDHGQRVDALSEEFRERFGFGLVRAQVNLFRAAHGTQTRRSRRGGRPRVPVGTERTSKDGYVVIKVREEATVPMSKDNWKLKHVWVWEQANGPLPEGHVVYFADGDKTNFDPENLVAIPRRLVGVLNSLEVKWHDAESLKVAVAMAELRVARNSAEAMVVRTCACCGNPFTNASRRAAGNTGTRVCPECGAKGLKTPSGGRRAKYDHAEILRLYSLGWERYKIAEMIGCSRSTVSNVVNGDLEKRREARRAKREQIIAS